MKLASIETITEIRPHPNAERLELAKVLGWQTVVRKGEFKAGDNIVFVVIDTILPFAPWSKFLRDKDRPDRRIRLKTAKLRGEYSQGLCLPLSVLPEHVREWQVGADVGCELGITKYEKEIPLSLSGIAKGSFPTHIVSKTDEDNGLSNPELVAETLRYPCQLTLKLDGSSCTVIVEGGKIIEVCSRNLSLCESDTNAFWSAAKAIKLSDVPPNGRFVIQGELMGPGIQGNQLGLSTPTLYAFQMKNGMEWFSDTAARGMAFTMGIPFVPTLNYEGPWSLEALQEFADSVKLPDGKPAEGIVVRPELPIASGIGRPLGFKLINRNYRD